MLFEPVPLLVGLMAATSASASPCRPSRPTPTLPSTGSGAQLSTPDSILNLLKIAVGHGLQNYTCADNSANTTATGALAVLYDVSSFYPGTPGTGLSTEAFSNLTSAVLWTQSIPLNLEDESAASPGTIVAPNALAESKYGAVVDSPFPEPADLALSNVLSAPAPFLGHHYFDSTGTPTFDLSTESLIGSMKKNGSATAPATADKGILDTSAVDWLQLIDAGNGIGTGIKAVYRVVTAGGASEACSAMDAPAGSVPYTALYWFYV